MKNSINKIVFSFLLLLSHLNSYSESIRHRIDGWVVRNDFSFYGYQNNHCGTLSLFYYDRNQNLKWELQDTFIEAPYFKVNYFGINEKKKEIILAGYSQLTDDVIAAIDFRVYSIDTTGKVKNVFRRPGEYNRRNSFITENAFANLKDSIYYFGFETVRNSASTMYKLETNLSVIDSTVVPYHFQDMYIGNDNQLLVNASMINEWQYLWRPLNKLDSSLFRTDVGTKKIKQDKFIWYLGNNKIIRVDPNTHNVTARNFENLYNDIHHVQVIDSVIMILGTQKQNNRYTISKWNFEILKLIEDRVLGFSSVNSQVPILFHFRDSQILIHSSYIAGYNDLRFFSGNYSSTLKIADVSIDSMTFIGIDSIQRIPSGSGHLKYQQTIQVCGKISNHFGKPIEVEKLGTNIYYGFNCGGYEVILDNSEIIPPNDSKWICDTITYYFGDIENRNICLSIGLIKDVIDTILTNNSKCLTTVSIKERRISTLITLYPVPVNDILNIESTTKLEQAQIFTISGQLIKSIKQVNTLQIDVSDLIPGLYVIKLGYKGNFAVRKFIKS